MGFIHFIVSSISEACHEHQNPIEIANNWAQHRCAAGHGITSLFDLTCHTVVLF